MRRESARQQGAHSVQSNMSVLFMSTYSKLMFMCRLQYSCPPLSKQCDRNSTKTQMGTVGHHRCFANAKSTIFSHSTKEIEQMGSHETGTFTLIQKEENLIVYNITEPLVYEWLMVLLLLFIKYSNFHN